MYCSTGPPGTNWMTTKVRNSTPRSVGSINRMRLTMYANMRASGGCLGRDAGPPGGQEPVHVGHALGRVRRDDLRVLQLPLAPRDAARARRPGRDQVVLVRDHAVQRTAGGGEVLAVVRDGEPRDQRVDGGILDAGIVAR